MDPVTLALLGTSALGGILGSRHPKINQLYLAQHYGTNEIATRAQDLARQILASPYGQQLMSSAAASGQQFQTGVAQAAGVAGLGGAGAATSGTSDFATAAAPQVQAGLERNVKSGILANALPIAENSVAQDRAQYIADTLNQPNPWQTVGNVAGQAAAMSLASPKPAGAVISPSAGTSSVAQEFGPAPVPGARQRPGGPTLSDTGPVGSLIMQQKRNRWRSLAYNGSAVQPAGAWQ